MRDLILELKELRLHGMTAAWAELIAPGTNTALEEARWLIEHLLQAETVDRSIRSVSHQMYSAKFPVHRDLAGFDFAVSPVDRKLVAQLAEMRFTEQAHNVVLVGGPGTGKSHLATAIGVSGITRHGKRVRFYSTIDLVNALEQETRTPSAWARLAMPTQSGACSISHGKCNSSAKSAKGSSGRRADSMLTSPVRTQ